MRPNTLKRTAVGIVAAAGIAAGSLAGATVSSAAPDTVVRQAVVAGETGTLAVNNFGLTSSQAKGVQRWLKARWSYRDSIDGQLGTNSWKAFQRHLKASHGYSGPIDGIAGPGTRAAFGKFGDWARSAY
ncbi:peptidoglycan-binding domain-containing protein [Streptomyces sp. NPDC098077]|uniref:peptidoglycan-binding domain-containing protein n=1 Tax=Streptomyces sp. NPDC098077 TaxID=3366093 RepID=UPI0037F42016